MAAETVAAKAATVSTGRGMPTPMLCEQRQREGQPDERREDKDEEATHKHIINPIPAPAR